MKLNLLFLPCAVLLQVAVAMGAENLPSLLTKVVPSSPAAILRRPSIVFIECHGLGAEDLSCYGQTNYQTPNLDRLAASGIKFTGYQVGMPGNCPATAALLSGKNETDVPDQNNLASLLNQAGYRTGFIGEWNPGSLPWERGFNEFAGFLDDNEGRNYYADYFWRYTPDFFYNKTLGQWTEWKPKDGPNTGGKEVIFDNLAGKKGRYLPDELFHWAANFVRNNEPDKFNHFRPFFLLVNLPAPRTATPGMDDFPVPTDAPFTGESWPQAAKNRAALVVRLDSGVGRFLEQLGKSRLTNNLALFFTGLNTPEKFADTNLARIFHPTQPNKVPMILHWPGQLPERHTSDVAWTAADFAPTVLDIALIKPILPFAGTSVLPLLSGKTTRRGGVEKP